MLWHATASWFRFVKGFPSKHNIIQAPEGKSHHWKWLHGMSEIKARSEAGNPQTLTFRCSKI